MTSFDRTPRVAVVGGGVIGLACAWRLARAGCAVEVFDRGVAGHAASWVSGGMLAPVSEYGFEDDAFFELAVRSHDRYPQFLVELELDAGTRVPLNTRGTLMVGVDRDDAEAIRRLYRFRESKGLAVSWLTGSEAREEEPLLSPRVSAAMWIPDDWEVDNRALVRALAAAVRAREGRVHENTPVEALDVRAGRVAGVVAGGRTHPADVVVLAAGAWSGVIEAVPEALRPPVRPVKGQVVSLRRTGDCPLERVVRTPDCYLVPKADGRLIVGATQEEMGFDLDPTAGGVLRLLEHAWEAVPAIFDLPIDAIETGLRPASRDHLPVIGPGGLDGLVVATGHYRHGILLAPATSDAVCEGIIGGGFDPALSPFSPSRFAPADAATRPAHAGGATQPPAGHAGGDGAPTRRWTGAGP